MAQPVLKNRIINFREFQCGSEEEKNCHREAFNSLMIKMSELDKYEEVEELTHCENNDCRMVLTNEDRNYIDDWNWVSSNEDHYSDIQDKVDIMSRNKWAYYIWNCRFCGTKNLIEKERAHFAKNKSKVVIKEASSVSDKTKPCESPILLFLIDNSSSMEEEIVELADSNKLKANKELSAMVQELKKTQIYMKIKENQIAMLNQLRKNAGPDSRSQPYVEHFSKYKIVLCMIQAILEEMSSQKQKGKDIVLSMSKPITRKIGFMFFSSNVILQKIPRKNETKVIEISHREFPSEVDKDGHIKVDFNSFKDLYNVGRNNSEEYGMEVADFKFEDIALSNVTPSGQTALGPALSIAAGVVSGYGSGSLIVVVTDGKANKGVFSDDGHYEEEKKLLRLRLGKTKADTCLIKMEGKQAQGESSLDKFYRKYATCLTINMQDKQPLKDLQKRLISVIETSISSKTWNNQIKIKCQNPNIKYDKDLKKLKTKLFKEQQVEFISPQIEEGKFSAFDYRHPFMTQILIYYQSIETRQECKFMAYVMQKLIKYNDMSKKDEESINSVETLKNVLNYLEVEGEKLDFNNIPLSLCKQSFRSIIMNSYKHSISQHHNMKQEVMQDLDFFPIKRQFKTHKEYVKSLVEKAEQEEEEDFTKF